jgi:hypothetical protein
MDPNAKITYTCPKCGGQDYRFDLNAMRPDDIVPCPTCKHSEKFSVLEDNFNELLAKVLDGLGPMRITIRDTGCHFEVSPADSLRQRNQVQKMLREIQGQIELKIATEPDCGHCHISVHEKHLAIVKEILKCRDFGFGTCVINAGTGEAFFYVDKFKGKNSRVPIEFVRSAFEGFQKIKVVGESRSVKPDTTDATPARRTKWWHFWTL